MKKPHVTCVLLIMIAFTLIVSCDRQESKQTKEPGTENAKTQGKVAFKINGRPVYKDEMSVRDINTAINDEILFEAALIKGVDKEPRVEKTLKIYKRNFIVGTMKKKIIDDFLKNYQLSDEQINKYYEENKDKYSIINVHKLIIQDKSKAEEIHNKLVNGEAIDDIVNEYKKPNTEIIVQKIFNTRRYHNLFDSLEVGKISKPVDQQNDMVIYVIFKADVKPLDALKKNIKYSLLNEQKRKAIADYIEKTKKENSIKVERLL